MFSGTDRPRHPVQSHKCDWARKAGTFPSPATAGSEIGMGQKLLAPGHPQELPGKTGFFSHWERLNLCGVDRELWRLLPSLRDSLPESRAVTKEQTDSQIERETPGSSHA